MGGFYCVSVLCATKKIMSEANIFSEVPWWCMRQDSNLSAQLRLAEQVESFL